MTKWATGSAEEFLEDIMKPNRLERLEEYFQDSARVVLFDNRFGGEWMVDIRGHFADFEIDEINRALKSVNRAGKL